MPALIKLANAHDEAAHKQCPIQFGVARTSEEVMGAWGLVYDAYRMLGIINPNPWGVHTTTHAFTNETTVIRGTLNGRCVSTVTTYLDHPEYGLPLDSVYPDELKRLRDKGHNIIELGLLADRRSEVKRSRPALFELMRWGSYFGIINGFRQAVVGIHPHHAKFYDKCFGFDIIGKEHSYDLVNGAPVVPLFVDYDKCLLTGRLSRGMQYLCNNRLDDLDYAKRMRWTRDIKQRGTVGEMLLHELCPGIAAA